MKLEISLTSIYRQIKDKGLVPLKRVAKNNYYDQKDFSSLQNKRYVSIEKSRKKILLIEYWIQMRGSKTDLEISIETGFSEALLRKTITEYLNNDKCITIKSKLCEVN